MSFIEVPFNFIHNQIILQPEIPDLGQVHMLLDTGTDPSALDLAFAQAKGRRLSPLAETGTGAGTQAVTLFATDPLEIRLGNLVATNVTALGVDLAKVANRLGQPLHGVLGYSFLAKRVVQIDYPQRVLRFYPDAATYQAAHPSPRPHAGIPMLLWDNFPLIEQVYVNHTPIRATLDTGSSGALTLFPAAIHHLGLTQTVPANPTSNAIGYGGREEQHKGRVDSVAFANVDFGPTEVTFVSSGNRAQTPLTERGGNIGNGLLKNCVLTLDYQNQFIFLDPPHAERAHPS